MFICSLSTQFFVFRDDDDLYYLFLNFRVYMYIYRYIQIYSSGRKGATPEFISHIIAFLHIYLDTYFYIQRSTTISTLYIMTESSQPKQSSKLSQPTRTSQTNDASPETPLPPVIYPKRKRKGLFTKDIENLLFAMGDAPYTQESTINAIEDILIDYVTMLASKMVHRASSQGRRNRIKLNDLAFVLRHDPLKLSRMLYILEQSHRIEKAKKMFNDDDDAQDASGKKVKRKGGGLFDDESDGDDDEEDDGGDGENGEGGGERGVHYNEEDGEDGEGGSKEESLLGEPVLDAEGNIIRRKRKYKKRAVEYDENGNVIKKKYKKRKTAATAEGDKK